MQVTNLTFSKTIQAAQYEPEVLEATAILEDGDDFERCARDLRSRISTALGRGTTVATRTEATTETKVAKKRASSKKAEAEVVEPDVEAPKKRAGKRAKKAVAYDREVKAHSAELGKILHANFKGWNKDDDLKLLAKAASTELVGVDFMDSDGNVLDSFVEAVRDRMAGEESGL